MKKIDNKKEKLILLIQQSKAIVENMINIYQFSVNELEERDDDFLLIAKEKQKYMQFQTSLQVMRMYEDRLLNSHLHPILLVDHLYEDFICWVKYIEEKCIESIDTVPLNMFDKIYAEAYSEIYCSEYLNVKKEEAPSLIDEELDDDDW